MNWGALTSWLAFLGTFLLCGLCLSLLFPFLDLLFSLQPLHAGDHAGFYFDRVAVHVQVDLPIEQLLLDVGDRGSILASDLH